MFAGIPIRTTLDNSTTVQYSGLIHQLTAKARGTVRDIDPQVKYTSDLHVYTRFLYIKYKILNSDTNIRLK